MSRPSPDVADNSRCADTRTPTDEEPLTANILFVAFKLKPINFHSWPAIRRRPKFDALPGKLHVRALEIHLVNMPARSVRFVLVRSIQVHVRMCLCRFNRRDATTSFQDRMCPRVALERHRKSLRRQFVRHARRRQRVSERQTAPHRYRPRPDPVAAAARQRFRDHEAGGHTLLACSISVCPNCRACSASNPTHAMCFPKVKITFPFDDPTAIFNSPSSVGWIFPLETYL